MKEQFSEAEWALLRDTPHWVAVAMSSSARSGLIGTAREMFHAGGALHAAARHEDDLIRAVAAIEEMQQTQESLIGATRDIPNEQVPEHTQSVALAKARQAMGIIVTKVPEHADAYRDWILDIAERVAGASKEGGFLGFGGTRISEPEEMLLGKLKAALA